MIVLDASIVVELLLGRPRGAVAWARILADGGDPAAPALLDAEVVHALRALARGGGLPVGRASDAVRDLSAMRVARYPLAALLRVWALRDNLTAYDACYVALAEALGAELLTCDPRIARAPGHAARITVLAAP